VYTWALFAGKGAKNPATGKQVNAGVALLELRVRFISGIVVVDTLPRHHPPNLNSTVHLVAVRSCRRRRTSAGAGGCRWGSSSTTSRCVPRCATVAASAERTAPWHECPGPRSHGAPLEGNTPMHATSSCRSHLGLFVRGRATLPPRFPGQLFAAGLFKPSIGVGGFYAFCQASFLITLLFYWLVNFDRARIVAFRQFTVMHSAVGCWHRFTQSLSRTGAWSGWWRRRGGGGAASVEQAGAL
jgi:hypothetical protein